MELHLTARPAELPDARIKVRSTPGEGSCFALIVNRLTPSSTSA
jgi:hypothetical protein